MLEYVVSSNGMTLVGMNHYTRGGEGDDYYLWMYTEVVRGEGAEIPAEILQAIRNPLGCATIASVKCRTRSMMGRCQGGYCQMRISQLLEQETGLKETELVYMRKNGHPFFGKVRDASGCDLKIGGSEPPETAGPGSEADHGSKEVAQ